jgi:hypothetical protein
MCCRLFPILISCLQIAALILFSVVTPLAHLHQKDTAPSHQAGAGHGAHPATTFHAHFEGHDTGQDHGRDSDSDDEEDSLSLSHGKIDAPRVKRSADQSLVIASSIEDARPWAPAFWILSDPSQNAHGPPHPFLKPVRAPPFYS